MAFPVFEWTVEKKEGESLRTGLKNNEKRVRMLKMLIPSKAPEQASCKYLMLARDAYLRLLVLDWI